MTDYKLGIVVIANLKGRINLEDVATRRVVELEKQDIYLQTRHKCILIGSCAEVFNFDSQMCASNVIEHF